MLKNLKKNPFDFIFCIFFFYLFIHLTKENLQYSDSFSLIPMREIDDFSFQNILREMIYELKNFQIGYFFNHYNFGYSNLWWSMNALMVFPVHKFHSLHIFLPRFLAQFFAMSSLILLYLPLRNISRLLALMIIFITGFSLVFIQFSTFFHNHSLLFFISSLLFYLFVKENFNYKRVLIINVLSMIGIAIKITFIPVGLFFIVYSWIKYSSYEKISLKLVLKGIGVLLSSYIISISPLNLLLYNIPESLRTYFHAIFHGSAIDNYSSKQITYNNLMWDINEVTMNFYNTHRVYFISFFILLLILSIILLHKKVFRLLPILSHFLYLIVLYFLYVKGFQNWDFAMYSSNMVGIFFLSLFYLFKYQHQLLNKVFIFIFVLIMIDNVYSVNKYNLNILNKYSHSERVKRDNKYLELVGKGVSFMAKYAQNKFKRIYYSFDLPHIYGLYHPKEKREDILFDYAQIRKEFVCTFIIFTHLHPPPKKYTIVYKDKVGGYAFTDRCKLNLDGDSFENHK